jgi:putative intracellular protease/amidase
MDAACGGDTELTVRPKLGFCNCDSGVADDDEVDRVADIDLVSPRFVPREAGHVVRVAEMPGRLRSYGLAMPDGAHHTAVGIAVSHRCDLLVAVAQGTGDAPEIERAAQEFLDTADMRRWMTSAMEGR